MERAIMMMMVRDISEKKEKQRFEEEITKEDVFYTVTVTLHNLQFHIEENKTFPRRHVRWCLFFHTPRADFYVLSLEVSLRLGQLVIFPER